MATVREGNRQALLIVDVQVGVMQSIWNADRVIENVAKAVGKARQRGVPVIWVQHSDDEEIPYGSPAWEWVPGLSPADGEARVQKQFNSSFEQTNLEEILAGYGIAHIVLAGAASNWCIRSTAYGALDRGYDLTLLKDAHGTESIEFEDGVVVEAAHIIRELNVAMTWTDYPDRTTGTADVDTFEFAPPAAPNSPNP